MAEGTEARDQLVEEHQHLVPRIAKKAYNYALSVGVCSVDRDDITSLVQEGLLRAAETFRPDRGASFSSYAWLRVMGHIKDELRKGDYLTRRERQVVQAFLRGDEISGQRERYAARLAAQRQVASFDPALGLANADSTEGAALTVELVNEALRYLSPMERAVLSYRYLHGMSVSAVAALMHVSDGRISQITKAVQRRLQEAFEVEAG